MKSYILKYSAIVLAGLLTQWWLFLFAPFAIPEHVPGTNLKTEGLVLITFIVVICTSFIRLLPASRFLPGYGKSLGMGSHHHGELIHFRHHLKNY
ncbi:hypothetical protein [uncultured Chitinophaga sp.]|jgi:hypothetical protein|uniref:hypothetical protein n=1 Tax=uncultured Chitinophaga sp. TaxID=339340 RepID=UPI00260239B0|nr:hypothetical protein [uncultured Chitinophaga sp.]